MEWASLQEPQTLGDWQWYGNQRETLGRQKLGNGSGIDPLTSSPDIWADIVVPAPDYTAPPVSVPDVSSPTFDAALGHLVDSGGSVFGGFDVNKLVDQLSTLYATYRRASGGVQTRPTPGQVTRLSDGSTLRTNPDGTTTIISPTGVARTVRADGSVVAGASADWLPGVNNGVVLAGAAALLFVVMRGKRR